MGRRQTFCVLAILQSLLFTRGADAEELRWTQFGLRPLGMGNAYVAVADDYNALFYNPAGLARLKEWDGEFLNPTVEASDTAINLVQDAMKLASAKKSSTAEILDEFQKKTGKINHISLYLTPHLIFKNFGMALGLELEVLTLVVHSDIDIEVKTGPRLIAPISYAHNFFEDKLSVGGTVKLLARAGVDNSFNIQTISAFASKSKSTETGDTSKTTDLSDFVEGGYGIGFDTGILFTPIKTMEPTLGVSVTDIGGSVYTKFDVSGTAVGAPDSRLPSVNTGISLKPIQGERSYVLVAADADSINQPVHYSQKLNFGTEWGYGKIIKVQAGLKAGYATAGFQFDVPLLTLRFATYTVDHAPVVATHDDLTERRFLVQLKLLI
jgi:hypothetical protein